MVLPYDLSWQYMTSHYEKRLIVLLDKHSFSMSQGLTSDTRQRTTEKDPLRIINFFQNMTELINKTKYVQEDSLFAKNQKIFSQSVPRVRNHEVLNAPVNHTNETPLGIHYYFFPFLGKSGLISLRRSNAWNCEFEPAVFSN